ncbi:MAG: outer membrane beta-barrel protein [Bacteroidales bacterium]|nr:outer membrane beta-barrel protein [Bacteroidales bacterium]
MEEQRENMDQFFRDELKDYSPELPVDMWGKIAINIPQKRKKLILPLFWKVAAGIAIVVSTATLVLKLSSPDKNTGYALAGSDTASTVKIISSQPLPVKITQQSTLEIAVPKSNSKNTLSQNSVVSAKNNKKPALPDPPDNLPETQPIHTESQVDKQPAYPVKYAEAVNENNLVPVVDTIQQQPLLAEQHSIPLPFDEYQEEKSKIRWLIGGQAGPQYSYRTIASESIDAAKIAAVNNTESSVIAYAGGINIEMRPGRKLSIQSGIYYSKIGVEQVARATVSGAFFENYSREEFSATIEATSITYRFPNSSVEFVPKTNTGSTEKNSNNIDASPISPLSPSWGPSYVEEPPMEVSATRFFEYMELPLLARYTLIDRKIGLQFLGGLSTNILLSNVTYIDDPNAAVHTAKNVNPVSFSSTLGFGLSYEISPRINLSLEPQFKYFLSKQTSNEYLNIHPYSLGVFTGVKYLF